MMRITYVSEQLLSPMQAHDWEALSSSYYTLWKWWELPTFQRNLSPLQVHDWHLTVYTPSNSISGSSTLKKEIATSLKHQLFFTILTQYNIQKTTVNTISLKTSSLIYTNWFLLLLIVVLFLHLSKIWGRGGSSMACEIITMRVWSCWMQSKHFVRSLTFSLA
jgi:hypothetical protein